ncbi:phosphotriesterase family protein [Humibacter ginsenosidimutans]|uniref:Aryldialkylphosphatase n=1 Tax=Humibacter ginsenosidimutans TaxID=2599293 RepID=A0A5B8M2I3_9MICO|nr:aryldialkylphosphatase [Humibacter ginsenosidimutans]QDZ14164.1 aryldialkylphosphatase [Humibacter ginsenosidimutans]
MTDNTAVIDDLGPVPDLRGKALTVRGAVDPSVLGETLMHEHLVVDLRRPVDALRPGEGAPTTAEPLTLANLAEVRNGSPNADNDVIDDLDLVTEEVEAFARLGGGAVVDVTVAGIGRDPRALLELSRRTGLHVVMGGGFYTTTFHPRDFAERTDDELAAGIARDVVVGVDATDIRTGIIGEIAAENAPLVDAEWRSVRAAARASRITGAPMSFHHGGQGEEKLRVLDLCTEEGVPDDNIVMGHSGGLATDIGLAERVLARGVFVEFDFVASPGSPWGHLVLGSDHRVVAGIAELVKRGYADQLLLGHDICQKIQLKRYGGHGYDYITRHFLPALSDAGVPDDALRQIMVDNPARALAFAAPGD